MHRILREIFTRDNALHIPLGLGLGFLAVGAGGIPSPWAEVIAGTCALYLREVIQHQTRDQLPFYRGWILDLHHNMEWAAPGVALFALAGGLELIR